MSDPIDDFVIRKFHIAYQALSDFDLPRLEDLAREGPFPCGCDGWSGRRWLTHAVDTGNARAVAWVLGHHPAVDHVDDMGFTALKSALQLETDLTLHIENPLSGAEATARTIEIIDLLLDAGADINQRLTFDSTALHFAAVHASPAVVSHLLARGADPLAIEMDYSPRTPADLATGRKREEVRTLLSAAMAQARTSREGGE